MLKHLIKNRKLLIPIGIFLVIILVFFIVFELIHRNNSPIPNLNNDLSIIPEEPIDILVVEDLSYDNTSNNIDDDVSTIIELKEQPLIPFYKKIEVKYGEKNLLERISDGNFSKLNLQVQNEINIQKNKIKEEQDLAVKEIEKFLGYEVKVSTKWIDAMNGITIIIKYKDLEKVRNLSLGKVFEDKEEYLDLSESVPLIDANDVWDMQNSTGSYLTGEGVIVAIVDSGIDYTHPDFGNCTLANFTAGNCSRFVYGYDFFDNDTDVMDIYGHGTHVAGIVGANGTIKGVAPEVKFLIYRACSIVCRSSSMISSIENATLSGADIITMSISTTSALNSVTKTAIDSGIVFTHSAGNSGPALFTITGIDNVSGIISVGLTNKSRNIQYYSSRGPYSSFSDPISKPDIVAPGYLINSTVPKSSCTLCSTSGYNTVSGTSMATPHVAGVAALIKQLHPEWSVLEIKSAILTTATETDLPEIESQGAGLINALKAINTEIVFNESNVFFGINNQSSDIIWSSIRDINVTNKYNGTLNYSFVSNLTITGLTIVLSENTIELDSNESFLLNINITINNSEVTTTDEIINGYIQINSSRSNNYKLPISFFLFVTKLDIGCPSNSTLINGTLIFPNNLTCKYWDDGSGIINTNTSVDNSILDCNGSTIWGPYMLNQYGIKVSNSENLTLRNCNVKGFINPIYIYSGSSRAVIKDSEITGEIAITGSSDVLIENNILKGRKELLNNDWDGRFGVNIAGTVSNISIINNRISKFYAGVYSSAKQVFIKNNTIYNCNTGMAIGANYDSPLYSYIENNSIFINGSGNPHQSNGMTLGSAAQNIILLNNFVNNTDYGILLQNAWNNTIKDFIYINKSGLSRSIYVAITDLVSGNNTIINSSIHNITVLDNEGYGNGLYVKNYLKVNVTDTIGNIINGANITIFENSTGIYEISNLSQTDITGFTNYIDVLYFYTYGRQEENRTAEIKVQVKAGGYETANFTIGTMNESKIVNLLLLTSVIPTITTSTEFWGSFFNALKPKTTITIIIIIVGTSIILLLLFNIIQKNKGIAHA